MQRVFISGRAVPARFASSGPLIIGMTTSLRRRGIDVETFRTSRKRRRRRD